MPMTVRTRPSRSGSAPRPRLPRRRWRAASAAPDATPAPHAEATAGQTTLTRERAAGGPEDVASYRCDCGCLFEASVSTSVGCPRCGTPQAW